MNILTMNQNVFGSSFETANRSNFTKNAINSELIIPDSAVELSYEEMEYVDGGNYVTYTGNNALKQLAKIGGMSFLQLSSVVATVAAAVGIAVGSSGSLGILSFTLIMEAAATLVFGIANSVAFFTGLAYYFSDKGFKSKKTSLLFFFDYYDVKRI